MHPRRPGAVESEYGRHTRRCCQRYYSIPAPRSRRVHAAKGNSHHWPGLKGLFRLLRVVEARTRSETPSRSTSLAGSCSTPQNNHIGLVRGPVGTETGLGVPRRWSQASSLAHRGSALGHFLIISIRPPDYTALGTCRPGSKDEDAKKKDAPTTTAPETGLT